MVSTRCSFVWLRRVGIGEIYMFFNSIIWLTGQPGSGKTVLGNIIVDHYQKQKRPVILIDGDDLREKTGNFDYTPEGRHRNITNAQMLARFLKKSGFTVVVALVAPYRNLREEFKKEFGSLITEVYVHCEDARGREAYHVSNYEPPLVNFIDIDTTNETPKQSFRKIQEHLSNYEVPWGID
jgi:adenylylsulfate kinase-like enzyme